MNVKLYWVLSSDKTDAQLANEDDFDSDREAESWITLTLKEMRAKNKKHKDLGYFCPFYILIEREKRGKITPQYLTL